MSKVAVGAAVTVAAISIVGNVLMYSRYSSHRPLIDVNDQVIRVKDLQDRLDYSYSKNVLRQMILDDLVMQEAQKEGVVPSADDIAQAKAQIQRTKPTLLTQAAQTDPTLELFTEQIKAKLALRNLEVKNVTVSEPEIEQYYTLHKSEFQLPAQTTSSVVYAKTPIAADTAVQMLNNGVSLTVIAQQPGLAVAGINAQQAQGLPQNIIQQVLQMKIGDVKSFPIGGITMIVRANAVEAQEVPALTVIHDQVEMAARQAKGLTDQQELANLVRNAHITAESDKYADAIPQVSGAPSNSQ